MTTEAVASPTADIQSKRCTVLGIDAAWTLKQPSGIALVIKRQAGWALVAASSSYDHFLALADRRATTPGRWLGSPANPDGMLAAASALCGQAVDLVAVDMPMARTPITARRASDDAVSKAYGSRQCGTHSPSAARPGPISNEFRQGFERAGYALRTEVITTPALIEVYPHPALVELSGAAKRLPYKVARARSYWPSASPAERRSLLLHQWREIEEQLEGEISGVCAALPKPDSRASGIVLKAYEDALDAITCAWVGICALEGRAVPYGDKDSAIWIPS